MKKIIAWLLVIVLTAGAAIGGTLAYLTDRDSEANVFTVGDVSIDLNENFDQGSELIPGKDINKDVQITNDGPNDAWVWYTYAVPTALVDQGDNASKNAIHFNLEGAYWDTYYTQEKYWQAAGLTGAVAWEETWHWQEIKHNVDVGLEDLYTVVSVLYNGVLEPGATTGVSLTNVYLDTRVDIDPEGNMNWIENGVATDLNWNVNEKGSPVVYVNAYAIQANEFDNVQDAYNAYIGQWGGLNGEYPEIGETLDAGTLSVALRNNGDEDITTKVSQVVFGKKSAYPDVVANYEGTLMDETDELSPMVYYVPNSEHTTYTIYILSDLPIYAPEDSTGLFRDMTALTSVSGLDMSYVTNAYGMFRGCTSLTTIDTSDWDTSNLTDARALFYNCTSLTTVDVSNWNMSNVTDGRWIFYGCSNLTSVDVSNWDTSSMTQTKSMFANCTKLTEVDVSNFDVSNVTDASYMFSNCQSVTSLDVSNWDTSSMTDISWIFRECRNLKDIDPSNWDTSNVTNMGQVFRYCFKIETLDLSKWDTSKVTNMKEMFSNNYAMQSLDISGFDISKVENIQWMFYATGCDSETGKCQIIVGDKWNVDNGLINKNLGVFWGCDTLVGGSGTTWADMLSHLGYTSSNSAITGVYAIADGGTENPGLLTYKASN